MKYKFLSNKLCALIRHKRRNHESIMVKNLKDKPKIFWNYLNMFRKSTNNIFEIKTSTGVTSHPADIAELFANFFEEFYIPKLPLNYKVFERAITDELLLDKLNPPSEYEIKEYIKDLSVGKVVGPDDLPVEFFKHTSEYIVKHIHRLFSLSLALGRMPALWKKARISPIYKSGNKTLLKNYRPISLLCILEKLLERKIYEEVSNQIVKNGRISNAQFGFKKNRCTTYQLLDVVNYIVRGFERNLPTDVIYIDYEKAFDKVPHSILLSKLKKPRT